MWGQQQGPSAPPATNYTQQTETSSTAFGQWGHNNNKQLPHQQTQFSSQTNLNCLNANSNANASNSNSLETANLSQHNPYISSQLVQQQQQMFSNQNQKSISNSTLFSKGQNKVDNQFYLQQQNSLQSQNYLVDQNQGQLQNQFQQSSNIINSTQNYPRNENSRDITDSFETQTNDNWGDWGDWNDNNQIIQNTKDNQNLIEESFHKKSNNNWQWDSDDNQSHSMPNIQMNQKFQQNPDKKSEPIGDVLKCESGSENTNQIQSNNFSKSYSNSEEKDLKYIDPAVAAHSRQNSSLKSSGLHHLVQTSRQNPVQQTIHSSPVTSPQHRNNQANDQDISEENNCQSTVSNTVYVSQAKPVSQPSRQYAMSPPTLGQSTPICSPSLNPSTLPSVQAISSNRNNSLPKSSTSANIISYPVNSQSPGVGNLPPPPSQTPPEQNLSIFPPPPPLIQTTVAVSNNPFKRTGQAQHHRSFTAAPSKNLSQTSSMSTQYFAPPPEDFRNAPPPKDFQNQLEQNNSVNQECLQPDNSEIVDKNFEVENFEVAPHTLNDDRNQYLQTSHLSEEGFSSGRQDDNNRQELNYENDNFPPPGLSRLVLGQPEIDSQQNNNIQTEIPPGLDRMIPGTELVASDLNLERQADGQDTIPSPRSAFTNVPPVEEQEVSNIDITTDRNLYLVPGESDIHEQRVVTGVENGLVNQNTQQRDIEMEGENLEDQQQQQHHDIVDMSRDEPIEGANSSDVVRNQNLIHETGSSLTLDTNLKDHSNVSTANDESDNRERQKSYFAKSQRKVEDKKRRPGGIEQGKEIDKRRGRYETEDSDLSSDRERRRYREGNSRNERDSRERDYREKREGSFKDIDYDRRREEKERDNRRYDRDRNRDKYDKEREHSKYVSRYETDSKYETEGSVRYERRRGGDRDHRERGDNDYRKHEERDRKYRRDDRDRDRDRERERDRRRGGDDREFGEERRDKRRDRERDRDYKTRSNGFDDEYRKTNSRNARETDREKDRFRDKESRYSQMYGFPPSYGYDPYAYYQQQQQYYEQLRRTNPQAYAEWYRKYFSQVQPDLMPTTTDGRESVHSGRSSTNDNKERPDNLSMNLMDGASTTAETQDQEPQRLTPFKFINEHSIVSLSAGLMVCVKPKYSQNGGAITNIVKILKFGPTVNDSTRRLFQTFPGPLVHGLTHKKTIIEFCQDQIRLGPPLLNNLKSKQNSSSSICSLGQTNKASFTLMWNLLILLLRQNGTIVGADIAELLMKNKQEFPYEISSQKSIILDRRDSTQSEIRKSKNNSPSDKGCGDNGDDRNSINDKSDDSDEFDDSKMSLSEEEITEKFRNYLLYGDVKEALEWATDNNLWGHALFLASKVDRRLHANVMMKFANKLSLNDPLQTLYQMMSGRTPSSVTSVQDEKWGDWRPHLAMIISNTSQKPELDRKAITTLGDSLYNRGDLFGAQFCYLMAQVGFGKYSLVNHDSMLMSNSSNAVRLVLLGSSQHKLFKEFATNEAIMMTEIYEYACALNDNKFSLVEFQPYKYLLATRMLDYGLQLKALTYMEQISLHIQHDPAKYDSIFIEKVCTLGDRLKFFDPVLEKNVDDQQSSLQIQDQKWLQDLRNILQEYCNLQSSTMVRNSEIPPNRSQIDQQFVEINQQFSELNLKYNNFNPMVQQSQQPITSENQLQQHIVQAQEVNQQQFEQYDQLGYSQSALTVNQQDATSKSQNNDLNSGMVSGQTYDQQTCDQQQHQQHQQQSNQNLYDPNQQSQNFQNENQQMNSNYDYWNQQHMQNEIPKPTISMPNSMSNKPGFFDDDGKNDEQQTNLNAKNVLTTRDTNKKVTAATISNSKSGLKNQNKNQSNTNSGWFGGIWNKLSLKPKNQMILPDDKNPTIVWDPDSKKWVNTEGDEDEQENFKPPPKMSDILPGNNAGISEISPNQLNHNNNPSLSSPPSSFIQSDGSQQYSQSYQQQASQSLTSSSPLINSNPLSAQAGNTNAIGETANKTPSLQSNMFKMQRNRTLKKSYVDVFNPSGLPSSQPVEPVLAPILPPVNIPQERLFIPGPVPTDDIQKHQSQDNVPQFYNPNEYSGY